MRFTLAHEGRFQVHPEVTQLLQTEHRSGLHLPEIYDKFRFRTENIRESLVSQITALNNTGCSVVGYGATAKSSTVLNYCELGPEQISWIQDSTRDKQGKLSPGSHIPIVSQQVFQKSSPNFAVLFAWNHQSEIEEKEKLWRTNGGKWVTYIPTVTVQ